MLPHMKRRTTLILDSAVHAALRARASREGRTFTEALEQALRVGLSARTAARRSRLRLPSYDLGPFLVDPSDRLALAALRGGGRREP
jgi:hypothetical protein